MLQAWSLYLDLMKTLTNALSSELKEIFLKIQEYCKQCNPKRFATLQSL